MSETENDLNDLKTLKEKGILLLMNDIDDKSAEGIVSDIIELNLSDNHSHIKLIINSAGGDLNSGFAIIEVMNFSKIPIHTIALG